jgi:hypothetical protein
MGCAPQAEVVVVVSEHSGLGCYLILSTRVVFSPLQFRQHDISIGRKDHWSRLTRYKQLPTSTQTSQKPRHSIMVPAFLT